jgi:hypothetical protein
LTKINYGEKTKNQADNTGLKFWLSGKMQSSGLDAGSASLAKDKKQ